MQIEKPTFENKINLNTIVLTVSLLFSFGWAIAQWVSQTAINEAQTTWQTQHMADHVVRRTERQRIDADMNARNALQDQLITKAISDIERIGDRIAAHDEAIKNANARSDRLADALGDLRGVLQESIQKLAVLQTILERIENKQLSLAAPPPDELTTGRARDETLATGR